MITDSQVGIQRPPGLRRTEQGKNPRLFSIVTDHYVAKLVSLLFAAILVAMIDREIQETLLESDFEVRVGSVSPSEAASAGRRQLVLETEAGVAIRFSKPDQVRVTIKGPQKLLEQVRKVLVARVLVKTEWLKDIGGTKHSSTRPIIGSDVSIDVRGVEISLDPPIQVDLDPERLHEVPLRGVPQQVNPDLIASVSFEPPTVRVLGPESLFNPGGIEQIMVAVPAAGRTQEYTWPVTALPDEVLQKHVRMAPDQRVIARVRFTKAAQEQFEVKDVPIMQSSPFGDEYKFDLIGLPKKAVTISFTGTPDAAKYWNERLDDLRRSIRAEINTAKLASKANPQPDAEPATDSLDVEIVGIPEDLKLVSVTPSKVEVSVIKK